MNAKSTHILMTASLTGLLAAGCTVGRNYEAPKVTVLGDWGEQGAEPTTQPGATTRASRTVSRGMPIVEWWTTFHDPVLDDLIGRAVADNLDLKRATARVREARAERGVARADLFPQANTSGSYQHARISEAGVASAFGGSGGINAGGGAQAPAGSNGSAAIPGSTFGSEFDLYQAGFDASWEIDVFGGKRRAVEAATADVQAAVEDRRDVLTTLLGEVARNYVELRQGQRRLQIARTNLASQQRTRDLTRELVSQSLTNELDAARAEAQVATTTAQIPALESAASQAIHRLGVLLGTRPTALASELGKEAAVPTVPDEIPVGLPSDLLRQRADVRRAERSIAGATARVGVATADLFPKFTLNGAAGLQSIEPGDLVNWSSRFYSLGPSVSWPIFDAGRIRSRINVQEAREEQAVLSYQQTVLTAVKDVEDALIAYGKTQERVTALRNAVQSQEKAVRIARDLYQQGVADFLSVLDAERTLYASQDSLAASEGDIATALVALYKSLGGGWQLDAIREATAIAR